MRSRELGLMILQASFQRGILCVSLILWFSCQRLKLTSGFMQLCELESEVCLERVVWEKAVGGGVLSTFAVQQLLSSGSCPQSPFVLGLPPSSLLSPILTWSLHVVSWSWTVSFLQACPVLWPVRRALMPSPGLLCPGCSGPVGLRPRQGPPALGAACPHCSLLPGAAVLCRVQNQSQSS